MKPICRTRRAFTLIELLMVITIIAILAGLILSTAGYVQKKGARARAEAEIAAMEAALESYKADNGIYVEGTGSLTLRRALMPVSGDPDYAATSKIYMEFKPTQLNNTTAAPARAPQSTSAIIDPFGTEYNYRSPGTYNTATFDLWSNGGLTPARANNAYSSTPATRNSNPSLNADYLNLIKNW